jgi:hypothetical protein
MQKLQWEYFPKDNVLQAKQERTSSLYWILSCEDIYTLNYSSDLFNLDFYDIIETSEDVDYLKDQASKHYESIIEYIQ